MRLYRADERVTLYHGDCLDVLRELPDASVDSVVTDPPYDLTNRTPDVMGCADCGRTLGGRDGTPGACPRCGGELTRQRSRQGKGFMGKEWDGTGIAFRPDVWRECLRILKPGGHMLAFGGSRTWHRLACAVEDAGFEIRDSIAWLYGSGFPKSLDVSKAIDKAAGAEREVVGEKVYAGGHIQRSNGTDLGIVNDDGWTPTDGRTDTAPATPDAERWQGWGTALKPAFEPVVVARKPLAGTVAANVLTHGTGALNIDGCRIEHASAADLATSLAKNPGRSDSVTSGVYGADRPQQRVNTDGRWPANVVLDGAMAAELDQQSGTSVSLGGSRGAGGQHGAYSPIPAQPDVTPGYGDEGGASRFFYVAKADASERPRVDGIAHPTVKPLALMQWLVRLVTPLGGTVLEPFAGSGTTVEACIVEGFRCIAIEREADYLPLIEARIARRLDPVRAIELAKEDAGLFALLAEEESA